MNVGISTLHSGYANTRLLAMCLKVVYEDSKGTNGQVKVDFWSPGMTFTDPSTLRFE